MNVVILEDERLTAQRLESLLKKYDPAIKVVVTLPSVEKAVDWFLQQEESEQAVPVDLVFMDIHLQDGLAFRVIEQVRLTKPIIFTTAFDEYLLQAFKVNSIDYLLKPLNYEELAAAIDKFKSLRQQYNPVAAEPAAPPAPAPDLDALLRMLAPPKEATYKERFMVTVGPKIWSVETNEIAYFFLDERIPFLVTKAGTNLPVEYSLDKLTQLLDPKQYFRVNRQCLVSLPAIRSITAYSAGKLKLELEPKPRFEVFVSGDRITDFKEWLGK
ncbi:LytTR family DNA-binding domain-containing protein [Telluribacter sp.]|jgi:DNA-binding LytR/AlgR family response regulator|uniref:LytR/AlgR family response regulator transcription factor n=1 Tax=Telluribacter sp. TaxID=1978767 RepID=UPI002E0ED0B3|nr:LytTR family DNA-binding domain-containing protein [Telluribacter sp.]